MEVCVTGCYYWPEVYNTLNYHAGGSREYRVYVVTHTDQSPTEYENLIMVRGPDYGLDAGKYDFFLKNLWDGRSGVFFMHDDVVLSRPEENPLAFVEEHLEDRDAVFFFGNNYQALKRRGRNFRTMYLSRKYLRSMLDYPCDCRESRSYYDKLVQQEVPGLGIHNGFLHDQNNPGITSNDKAVPGMRDVNVSCRHFLREQWIRLSNIERLTWGTVVDDFMTFAIRGAIKTKGKHTSNIPRFLLKDTEDIVDGLYGET